MLTTLGIIDLLVLLGSLLLAIVVGLRMSGKTTSVEAFLLGDRNLPWWAILGSIVATETSTATVLSLPGLAFGPSGMKFLQIGIGYILGRSIVVGFLLPLYFKGELFSAYQVLDERFGHATKYFASLLFLVTRNIGDGLRLFLAAMVLQKLVGWSFVGSAVVIGGITIAYTYFGGMRSVVWNDCIQLVIYLLGAVATVFVIAAAIDGGWAEFWQFAKTNHKLEVFQFSPSAGPNIATTSFGRWLVTDPFSFWAGLVGGAVLTLGTHGTDQMMVQRYLSARSQRDASYAILFSGLVVFLQFVLFLFIGAMLACYYAPHPEILFQRTDEVYAHFIINSFPKNTGLVGLLLAAILAAAMSTLSSSLNASASAVLNDFYLPLRGVAGRSSSQLLATTRRLAVGFGMLQIAIGVWATTFDATIVSNALTIAGFSAGLLLGLFSLGVLTPGVNQWQALVGAGVGLASLLSAQFVAPALGWPIAWPWFALIGASTTFATGYTLSILVPKYPNQNS